MKQTSKFLQLFFLSFFVIGLAGCAAPSYLLRQMRAPVYVKFQGAMYNDQYWTENNKKTVQAQFKKDGIALIMIPSAKGYGYCGIKESNDTAQVMQNHFEKNIKIFSIKNTIFLEY